MSVYTTKHSWPYRKLFINICDSITVIQVIMNKMNKGGLRLGLCEIGLGVCVRVTMRLSLLLAALQGYKSLKNCRVCQRPHASLNHKAVQMTNMLYHTVSWLGKGISAHIFADHIDSRSFCIQLVQIHYFQFNLRSF